ncbi:MAG: MmgE/PrpD family protein, partial [Synergistaceae bacterium]|nr:MmgE/PrpD family protein [Synergistaceae bacterium]
TTSITHKYSVGADAITSVVAAQLSHPYVCSVALLEGNAFIDQFTEEKIKDPRILEFAKKVEVVADDEIDNLPRHLRYTVKVDVHVKDGRVFNLKETYPKGHPKNPFTHDELLWKFNSLAEKAIPDKGRRERITDSVLNLERLDNVKELTTLMATGN